MTPRRSQNQLFDKVYCLKRTEDLLEFDNEKAMAQTPRSPSKNNRPVSKTYQTNIKFDDEDEL